MYKPDSKNESKPSKIKGVSCARYCLLCLACSEDPNLDRSTFPETVGLGTLCDGLSWDASKQADFEKTLSTARLPAPLPRTSNPESVLFPVSQRKAVQGGGSVAAWLRHRARRLGPARIPPRRGSSSHWAGFLRGAMATHLGLQSGGERVVWESGTWFLACASIRLGVFVPADWSCNTNPFRNKTSISAARRLYRCISFFLNAH